jgi:CheY-like chemotaxis protein
MRLVLVVDDDSAIRSSLSECLGACGYSVAEAADAADGFLKLRSLRPHVVLLDHRIPSFTYGEKFLRDKAADPEVASIPVVVMSGYLKLPNAEGVVAFLQKPFNLDDVLAVVEKFAGPPNGPAFAA